jgi:fatty acid desaturase
MHQSQQQQPQRRSLGRTIVAGLIVIVALWVLLGFVIHVIAAVASVVLIIIAVVALIWALRVLL